MGKGVFSSRPRNPYVIAIWWQHVSHSIRRMDQNVCCGNSEVETEGESLLSNHVDSRRLWSPRKIRIRLAALRVIYHHLHPGFLVWSVELKTQPTLEMEGAAAFQWRCSILVRNEERHEFISSNTLLKYQVRTFDKRNLLIGNNYCDAAKWYIYVLLCKLLIVGHSSSAKQNNFIWG